MQEPDEQSEPAEHGSPTLFFFSGIPPGVGSARPPDGVEGLGKGTGASPEPAEGAGEQPPEQASKIPTIPTVAGRRTADVRMGDLAQPRGRGWDARRE